jgi:hypothetical protein
MHICAIALLYIISLDAMETENSQPIQTNQLNQACAQLRKNPLYCVAYRQLTLEEQEAMSISGYEENPTQARQVITKLAQQFYEILNSETRIGTADDFAQSIIAVREQITSNTPIVVFDSHSAHLRATQLLSPAERKTLSKKNYIENNAAAQETIKKYATHYYNIWLSHQTSLGNIQQPREQIIQELIIEKRDELNAAYGLKND